MSRLDEICSKSDFSERLPSNAGVKKHARSKIII